MITRASFSLVASLAWTLFSLAQDGKVRTVTGAKFTALLTLINGIVQSIYNSALEREMAARVKPSGIFGANHVCASFSPGFMELTRGHFREVNYFVAARRSSIIFDTLRPAARDFLSRKNLVARTI